MKVSDKVWMISQICTVLAEWFSRRAFVTMQRRKKDFEVICRKNLIYYHETPHIMACVWVKNCISKWIIILQIFIRLIPKNIKVHFHLPYFGLLRKKKRMELNSILTQVPKCILNCSDYLTGPEFNCMTIFHCQYKCIYIWDIIFIF